MDIYLVVLGAVLTTVFALSRISASPGEGATAVGWESGVFFALFFLVQAADYLQGPYLFSAMASLGGDKGGLLYTLGMAATAFCAPLVAAPLNLRFGPRLAFAVMGVVSALSAGIIGLIRVDEGGATFGGAALGSVAELLVVSRVLAGCAAALLQTSPEAWVMAAAPAEARGGAMSSLNSLFGVAAISGSLLAPLLVSSPSGHGQEAFLASAALFLLASVLIIAFMRDARPAPSKASSSLASTIASLATTPGVLATTLTQGSFELAMLCFSITAFGALQGDGGVNPGMLLSLMMAFMILGSVSFGLLLAKAARDVALFRAGVVLGLTVIVAAFAFPQSLVVCMCGFQIALGLCFPSLGMIRARVAKPADLGVYLNLLRVPANLLIMWISVLGLSTQQSFGLAGAFCIASLLASALLPTERVKAD